MTRTKTLIVLGVFMFILAVLAALDLTSEQQPKVADGQMVTGAMTKQAQVAPMAEKVEPPKASAVVPNEPPKNIDTKDVPTKDMTPKSQNSSEGILLPLDNGTLRSNSDSAMPLAPVAGNFQAELNKIIIEKPEAGSQPVEVAPVNPESQKQAEIARQAERIPVERTQLEPQTRTRSSRESSGSKEFKDMKDSKEPKTAQESKDIKASKDVSAQKPSASPEPKPASAKDLDSNIEQNTEEGTTEKREVTPIIISTGAPAKLQAKQKAIQSTRLELGRTIVFQIVGTEPLTSKKILLANPDRYVVDLQGDWGIVLPKVPGNRLLKIIRSGTRTDATRLVFELNSTPESAEVKQINQNTLEVRIKPGN